MQHRPHFFSNKAMQLTWINLLQSTLAFVNAWLEVPLLGNIFATKKFYVSFY